jgi:deoxyuridine 5'-triphosphate nucleotidohydrolase
MSFSHKTQDHMTSVVGPVLPPHGDLDAPALAPFDDYAVIDTVALESGFLPEVQCAGDVAADVKARAILANNKGERIAKTLAHDAWILAPGERCLVGVGFQLKLPAGFRARMHSRSGLAINHGIEIGAGLIDNGYDGELGVMVYNHGESNFVITHGLRIGQVCIERYTHPVFVTKEMPFHNDILLRDMGKPTRGHAGLGHTGAH